MVFFFPLFFLYNSAWKPTGQASATTRVRNQVSLHKSTRDFHKPTHSIGTRSTHQDLWCVLSIIVRRSGCHDSHLLYAPQVTFMVNTMTFCDFSSMGVSLQKQTTSSLATTSTAVNNPSKPSASSSHTRSSTLKTFSSFVETTSVQASTEFTVFMTNVRCTLFHHRPGRYSRQQKANDGTTSSYGKRLLIALIVYPSPPSSMKRYLPCMADCPPIFNQWSKYEGS